MPQSLARVLLHVVFSTKNRVPFLRDVEIREALHGYVAGTLREIDCAPIVVGGVEDHIHILCNFSRTLTIAKLVEEVKRSSSKWVKDREHRLRDFYWQGGYGVFSTSQSQGQRVRDYIIKQEEHHQKTSFRDEFRLLCSRHEIEIDERYVWD